MIILTSGVQSPFVRCCAMVEQPEVIHEITKDH